MNLNANFMARAIVTPAPDKWVPSPLPGVERLMLDRIGEEVARATSLVRYAPRSRFDPHTHHKGEEFLVLDGVFTDAMGDYPAGTYVRNPPGSEHAPWSHDGCTIFVKLRQFDPQDRMRVVRDTTAAEGWCPLEDGASELLLHRFGDEEVCLLRLPTDTKWRPSRSGGAELLVLSGCLAVDGLSLGPWSWMRFPDGDRPALRTEQETRLYLKTGHLPRGDRCL
jgi:hypothetical protein